MSVVQVQRKLGLGVYTFPPGAAGALIRTSGMRTDCVGSHARDAVALISREADHQTGYHQTQCPSTTRLRVLKLKKVRYNGLYKPLEGLRV